MNLNLFFSKKKRKTRILCTFEEFGLELKRFTINIALVWFSCLMNVRGF